MTGMFTKISRYLLNRLFDDIFLVQSSLTT